MRLLLFAMPLYMVILNSLHAQDPLTRFREQNGLKAQSAKTELEKLLEQSDRLARTNPKEALLIARKALEILSKDISLPQAERVRLSHAVSVQLDDLYSRTQPISAGDKTSAQKLDEMQKAWSDWRKWERMPASSPIANTGFFFLSDRRFFKAANIVAQPPAKQIFYTVDGKRDSQPYDAIVILGVPGGDWRYNAKTGSFDFTHQADILENRFTTTLVQSIRRNQRLRDAAGQEYTPALADEIERQHLARRQQEAEQLAQRQREAELIAQQQQDAMAMAQRQRDAELAAGRRRQNEMLTEAGQSLKILGLFGLGVGSWVASRDWSGLHAVAGEFTPVTPVTGGRPRTSSSQTSPQQTTTASPQSPASSGYAVEIAISYSDGGRYAAQSFSYRYDQFGFMGSYLTASTNGQGRASVLLPSGATHMELIINNQRPSIPLRFSGGRYQPVVIRLN